MYKVIYFATIFAINYLIGCSAFAVVDPCNYKNLAINIKNSYTMLKQLNEAKNQLSQIKQQVANSKTNLALVVENAKQLNPQELADLKRNLKEMRSKLKNIQGLHQHLSELDQSYLQNFASPGNPRPTDEENQLTTKRIQATLKSNQRAIDSLSVLQSYEKEMKQMDKAIDSSHKATGMMQAAQSTNNMLALMAKNNQEMKLLLGHSLEQRTLALSQEQLDKDWSFKENQRFLNTKSKDKPNRKIKKLPKLTRNKR